jgi:hypothetical protein
MALEQKFNVPINLAGNALKNAILEALAAPNITNTGAFYYNTTNGFVGYNGTEWVPFDARKRTGIPLANLATDPLARANHTGTQVAATISDFDTQVRTSRLDQMAAPSASVSANGQKITNLATPTLATDAANKSYVDSTVQAAAQGIDPKDPVIVASTGNIASLSGLLTIDGVTLVAGNRVLVKDQTASQSNGIYIAAAGAWARSSDASQNTLTSGAVVLVLNGTVNSKTSWYLQTSDPITVGSTTLTWVLFYAPVNYTANEAAGLTLTGTQFSVKVGAGLSFDGSGNLQATGGSSGTVNKYSVAIGDGTATSFTVTHNLSTLDVAVSIRNTTTNDIEFAGVTCTSANVVTVSFGSAPASGAYKVTVVG